VVNPEDIEMLQDLILAAANEAIRRGKEMMAQEMQKLTGGLQLPGLPGGMGGLGDIFGA
jgi:DNA-binding protein YbaB